MTNDNRNYDAILVLSFGGPEKPEDVIPFLENVLRGKPVPRERMLEVAEHYYHFGGVSPINQQCRELLVALRRELDANDIHLPIYWGNRNWEPFLNDTLVRMKRDGIERVLTYVTSGFSCYSGCRQYRENIAAALQQPEAAGMQIDKLRVFYNHPDFIEVLTEQVGKALAAISTGDSQSGSCGIYRSQHSDEHGSYVRLRKAIERVMPSGRRRLSLTSLQYKLVYQSRSGRPEDPWLEPDILDFLRELKSTGIEDVVISPIGFLSDHMEVLYDLDDEAKHFCDEHSIRMVRAGTPGNHPKFIGMIRKLIQERLLDAPRECVGQFPPNHDVCPVDCCPAPTRPAAGRPMPGPTA